MATHIKNLSTQVLDNISTIYGDESVCIVVELDPILFRETVKFVRVIDGDAEGEELQREPVLQEAK